MRVLGLCAGNGVNLYPFEQFVIGNIEPRAIFHTKDDLQWYANFTAPIYRGFPKQKLLPDIIIGNPDCGHSSVFALSRAKKFGNPRDNESINKFVMGIRIYNPKIFLMENLEKLLEQITEDDFEDMFEGYRMIFHKSSVCEYGNSQKNRKRLVMIGVRKDVSYKVYKSLNKTYLVNDIKFTEELIGDLVDKYPDEKLCHIREEDDTIISIYGGKRMRISDIKDMWLNDYRGHKKWPVYDRNYKTAPGVYKLQPDKLPMTARKGNRQFNYQGEMMTPRELARIQGIPDKFKLVYYSENRNYFINKGRATVAKSPPYEIGLWFYQVILKHKNLI